MHCGSSSGGGKFPGNGKCQDLQSWMVRLHFKLEYPASRVLVKTRCTERHCRFWFNIRDTFCHSLLPNRCSNLMRHNTSQWASGIKIQDAHEIENCLTFLHPVDGDTIVLMAQGFHCSPCNVSTLCLIFPVALAFMSGCEINLLGKSS